MIAIQIVVVVVVVVLMASVITRFSGRFKLSLLQQSEGNTLAATEFIRLLEASGSVTAEQSSGTRENTQSLGSTAEFNPIT